MARRRSSAVRLRASPSRCPVPRRPGRPAARGSARPAPGQVGAVWSARSSARLRPAPAAARAGQPGLVLPRRGLPRRSARPARRSSVAAWPRRPGPSWPEIRRAASASCRLTSARRPLAGPWPRRRPRRAAARHVGRPGRPRELGRLRGRRPQADRPAGHRCRRGPVRAEQVAVQGDHPQPGVAAQHLAGLRQVGRDHDAVQQPDTAGANSPGS
jgi:hypothetical protein